MAVESPRSVGDPNYYLQETPIVPAHWIGDGARKLDLHNREVEPATFLNLCNGYTTDADGQQDKKLPKYMHPDRVQAIEITVNFPKSVSGANLVGGDRRIDDVAWESYLAVAAEVERQALVRTTKKTDKEKYKRAEGLAMAIFDHPANRLGTWHRHGHIVIMNIGLDSEKWKAIELSLIGIWQEPEKRDVNRPKEEIKGFGELTDIFNKTARKGLNRLGYKTKAIGRSFEIVGFPWDVKLLGSDRNADIKEMKREFEKKKGAALTAKTKKKLSVIDRPDKQIDMPLPERQKGWRARLTPPQLKAVMGVVQKSYNRVKDRAISQWQQGIAQHASQRRMNMIIHETETPVRSRNSGRSR